MEITKGSDLILILKLEDYKNEKMRVNDCTDFRLYVWTANRNNFLEFTKREITQDENIDKISIPDFMINCLESGVICYQYMYSKKSDDFVHTDSHYDKSKVVVTDIYWRNTNINEEPKNPVNYQTLNYLRDLIEYEALTREKAIYDLKQFVDNDFMDKLNAEIKRSNEVDIEFHKLVNNNHTECVNTSIELNEKLDAEIKRSTEKDIELFNLINSNNTDSADKSTILESKLNAEIARSKQADADHDNAVNNEVARATNAETIISTKLDGEIERAKTAEGAIRDAVENERDRAIVKESLLSDSISNLQTSLSETKTALEAEKERALDLDARHNAELNEVKTNLQTEIQRATDREEHINSDLHDEITRAKQAEADIIKDVKLTVYTKSEVDNLIDNVDVTDQLKDYAKKLETTCVTDENGAVITEMVIDNSTTDDSVEVYTREQSDERFALKGESPTFWNGTQTEYDALTTIDDNTIYFINKE